MATSVSRDIEALLLSMLLNQAVIFTLITRSIVSVDRVKRGSPQPETQGNQRINTVSNVPIDNGQVVQNLTILSWGKNEIMSNRMDYEGDFGCWAGCLIHIDY